jgi:hypothetical protein
MFPDHFLAPYIPVSRPGAQAPNPMSELQGWLLPAPNHIAVLVVLMLP